MSSVGQLKAETIGRPGLLGLLILGKKEIHEVLGVVMMRLVAVAGNSWLTTRPLIFAG